jgi:preprotein translocase subunit SecY
MEKFLNAVQNMFKVPELRTRILFTLSLLAVYRLGAHVTAPGINKDKTLSRFGETSPEPLLGVLDLFSGGNFRTISEFALGVPPYITASIIMQLMPVLSPAMKKIQEEGEVGRQKMNTEDTVPDRSSSVRFRHFFVANWLKRTASSGNLVGDGDDRHYSYDRNDLRDVARVSRYRTRRRKRQSRFLYSLVS